MLNLLAIFYLLTFLCGTCIAQGGKTANEASSRILSLENAWNEAEAKHDARALILLTTDKFRYTDSDGKFMNRNEWLAQIEAEKNDYEQLSNSKMEVDLYQGDVAVVTGEYREKQKAKKKALLLSGRFTDTWIQQNHEWKCVASQETLISQSH